MTSIGVSQSVVERMKQRVRGGYETSKDETGGNQEQVRTTNKHMSVVAWGVLYAQQVGDFSPEQDITILPHVEIKHMAAEYQSDMELAGRPEKLIASPEYFYKIWRQEPALRQYVISTLKANFQRCKVCIKFALAISKSRNGKERDFFRRKRTCHLMICKDERLWYVRWFDCAAGHRSCT